MNDEEPTRIPGLEHLSMEREPASDLWPGIEARLAPRRESFRPYAIAAALVAGIATLIGAAVLQAPTAPTPAPTAALASSSLAPSEVASADPMPIDSLPTARHAGRAPDAVAMRTLVKANLKIVVDGEKQLRRAIADHPDADYLHQLLASNQAQQRELRERLSQST